ISVESTARCENAPPTAGVSSRYIEFPYKQTDRQTERFIYSVSSRYIEFPYKQTDRQTDRALYI
ncbi:hypothetical protein V3C99_002361, partial [Haemonchus contortus]